MSTEQAAQLQKIYDKLISPSGMFTLTLGTTTDIKTALENTIIDYTKLTVDNFNFTTCHGTGGLRYTNPMYGGGGSTTPSITKSYNNSTGIFTYNNQYTTGESSTGGWYAGCYVDGIVLCCDISTSLKSNWKDYYTE